MVNPTTNNLTVVFTINDHEQFESERQRLFKMFKKPDGEPYAITAISIGHEIQRLELIEMCLDEDRPDLADFVFGLIDPSKYTSVEELEADYD